MSSNYTQAQLESGMAGLSKEQLGELVEMLRGREDKGTAEFAEKVFSDEKVVPMKVEHKVEVQSKAPLVPTSVEELQSYNGGVIVELPPFAEGQPFVARLVRPSMLKLVKSGQIPNSLIQQATSLFAKGTGALDNGRNSANVSEMFEIIDVIVDSALKEPTLDQIHAAGMELSDDQLMAIFSYTQRGVKALESFRTV